MAYFQTIFELKSSMNQKCYDIMKKTKQIHANYVNKFRDAQQENEQDEIEEDKTVCGKRKNLLQHMFAHKKKKSADNEYYVPYSAPDHNTESGYV